MFFWTCSCKIWYYSIVFPFWPWHSSASNIWHHWELCKFYVQLHMSLQPSWHTLFSKRNATLICPFPLVPPGHWPWHRVLLNLLIKWSCEWFEKDHILKFLTVKILREPWWILKWLLIDVPDPYTCPEVLIAVLTNFWKFAYPCPMIVSD